MATRILFATGELMAGSGIMLGFARALFLSLRSFQSELLPRMSLGRSMAKYRSLKERACEKREDRWVGLPVIVG